MELTMSTETQAGSTPDSIVKRSLIRSPRSRVWQAISDSKQFGAWFGVNLESEFRAGSITSGKLTFAGYEHLTMEMAVETIEPEQLFTYRWHPYALDPAVDYSSEP